jgi:endonuclease YncB( thermonuclease family)
MSTNPNDNDETGDIPSERPRTDLDVLRDLFGDWFGIASPGPDAPDSPDESTENGENGDDDDTETIGPTSVDTESGIPTFAGSKVYQHQAALVEVVDGDTLTVDVDLGFRTISQWRIRVAGVDTGEIYGTEKQSAEYQRGKDHEAFVEGWISDARVQYDGDWPLIVLSVEKGKYGRFISAIRRKSDGNILNDALISEFGMDVVSVQ